MQGAVTGGTAGHKGLAFSVEMSKEALAKREPTHTPNVLLCFLRRPEEIRNPDGDLRDLTEAALKKRGRRLLVVDQDIEPGRVWSLCELVHRSTRLAWIRSGHSDVHGRTYLSRRLNP